MTALTITRIAALANVSKATVSRVINGKPHVDPDTARRVLAIVAESGYVARASAVGLARGSSQCIGMLVPSLLWPWTTRVVQAVADDLEAAGYGLLLHTTSRAEGSLRAFELQVNRSAFDGLIVISPPGLLGYIHELYRRGLPVALIDDRGYHPEFPSVRTTHREGSAAVARHLTEGGRRHLACITGPSCYGVVTSRLMGVHEGLAEAGLVLSAGNVVESDFTEPGGYAAMAGLLDGGAALDAVVAQNDLMAAGALRCLRDRGLRVPEDVAVTGFDDIDLASLTRPALTTVRQPLAAMGSAAVDLVLRHVGGEQLSTEPLILPSELIVRASTGSAAVVISPSISMER